MKISNDYSSLLSSLNSNDTLGISLTDYASIKSGSYKKLMKAYYGQKSSSSAGTSSKADNTTVKNASNVKSAATGLKKAASDIESAIKSGDSDKIYKAVSSFADSYNETLSSVNTFGKSSTTKTAQNMINEIGNNLNLLSDAGIKISESGKMSVDEETVKNSTSALKSLFSGAGSLGSSIANRASTIANSAARVINSSKSTYTKAATDTVNTSTAIGSLYDSTT